MEAFDNLQCDLALHAQHQLKLSPHLINIVITFFLQGRWALVNWLLPIILYFFLTMLSSGSYLGTFLLLTLLETVLWTCLFEFCVTFANADDVLVIVWGPTRSLFKQRGNIALDFIRNWATIHKIYILFFAQVMFYIIW